MSDARIKEIKKARGLLKRKLTNFEKDLNRLVSTPILSDDQLTELERDLEGLGSLQDEFDKLQTELEGLSDSKEITKLFAEREKFKSKYYAAVAQAHQLLGPKRGRDEQTQRRQSTASADSELSGGHDFVRLPEIDLPSFEGDFQDWLEFRDTYISLIHNNKTISNINKFHYLRTSLKGRASLVIKGLDFIPNNYPEAWKLLSDRYDNERILTNKHVNALFNLPKAQQESSNALRNLIDLTNKNLCALSSLGQPTDHWDTLVIHIMCNKLDNITYRAWEEHRHSITGSSTLKQLITFINNRADLLDTIQTLKHHQEIPNKTLFHTQNIHKQTDQSKPRISDHTTCPLCKQFNSIQL